MKAPTRLELLEYATGRVREGATRHEIDDLESALREAEGIARAVAKRFVSDPDVIGLVSR